MARVVVVGLGPAGPELATTATLAAIESVPVGRRFVRTRRHPSVSLVGEAPSFDAVYEAAETLDAVYGEIVERLVAAATDGTGAPVLYAVPGSPLVAEHTVELLRADPRVDVELVVALSFLDLAWAALGVDPVAASVRLVDGHRFVEDAAGQPGPMLVAQCDHRSVLSAVKLAFDDQPPPRAVVLHHLGLADQAVAEVAWADLDRGVVEPDHLTALWLPELAAPVAAELVAFAELVRVLRAECPWDREQTHQSLTRHLLEEIYEVLEAIEALDDDGAGSGYPHLEEELGDLLFQVVFHATLAAEEGQFTLADVARGIHDKLVRRHPHVFGQVEVDDADDVMANWEQIKRDEKGRDSVFDGIADTLPSLLFAHKVQRKVVSVGGEVVPAPALDLDSIASDAEVGEALWAVVAVARRVDVDPESALRAAAVRHRETARADELAPADPPTPS